MLLGDYFNSFNLYKNSELPGNQIGKNGVQVKEENEDIPSFAHVLSETLNLVKSRCCFAEDGKEIN